jgi:hypothetical protein
MLGSLRGSLGGEIIGCMEWPKLRIGLLGIQKIPQHIWTRTRSFQLSVWRYQEYRKEKRYPICYNLARYRTFEC